MGHAPGCQSHRLGAGAGGCSRCGGSGGCGGGRAGLPAGRGNVAATEFLRHAAVARYRVGRRADCVGDSAGAGGGGSDSGGRFGAHCRGNPLSRWNVQHRCDAQ
ncbi:hypothetical protein E3T38_16390 [Cryobacterium sp. Hb1]|nr:hypothetical protein E3T38_16390 [Cryobacterium sp. Hb1]